ncbi:MAG TPA: hypothetical protein VKQ08_07525 [Cyclobacteriaceae bacterium]|nr:hypothetical protein [Cyclobacteriaceae bacterium]
MKIKMLKGLLVLGIAGGVILSCNRENLSTSSSSSAQSTLLAVGQTSSQLVSGTSFSVQTTSSGAAIDTTHGPPHAGHCKNDGMGSFLGGTNFLTPTNELIAIVDAESAGDIRGMRMYAQGGATVTNYDTNGNVVTMPSTGAQGPEGVSFSDGQFPLMDSLLEKIVKTVIDFGTGVSVKHDSTTITRGGRIIVTRVRNGNELTETITFENYTVNNNLIEGTKTRIHNFDASTGHGSSTSSVANGKITFSDGTVASWTSSKQRLTDITIDSTTLRPVSGTITTTASTAVTATEGTIIYSSNTTNPIIENVACGRAHHWPVSGTVETDYRSQMVVIDFGDGSCSNKTITVTINGVTTTKSIG